MGRKVSSPISRSTVATSIPAEARASSSPSVKWSPAVGGIRSEEPRLNSSHSQISYAVFCLKKTDQAFQLGPRDSVRRRRAGPLDPPSGEPGLLSCSRPSGVTSPMFFFNDTATTEIYTLSLHDALPISVV